MNDESPYPNIWQGVMTMDQVIANAKSNRDNWSHVRVFVEENFRTFGDRKHALELFKLGLYWLRPTTRRTFWQS